MTIKYSKEKYGYHIARFLYDWVLSWAGSPMGGYALFILTFAESSFLPILPDLLLIALILGAREKALRYALFCCIASITGGLCGYYIGYELWYTGSDYSSIANFFFTHIPGFTSELFAEIKAWYEQYSFWIVFAAGFTPIPYRSITITCGIAGIDLQMFIVASVISRSLRFCLVAFLIWKFGEPIKKFIDKRFEILSILFILLIVGVFLLIKYL